jgi:predicted transcriptional regulator
MSVKQLALDAINHLPEDADLATIQEEVALLAALEDAEADVKEGRLIPHSDVVKNFQQWLTT